MPAAKNEMTLRYFETLELGRSLMFSSGRVRVYTKIDDTYLV